MRRTISFCLTVRFTTFCLLPGPGRLCAPPSFLHEQLRDSAGCVFLLLGQCFLRSERTQLTTSCPVVLAGVWPVQARRYPDPRLDWGAERGDEHVMLLLSPAPLVARPRHPCAHKHQRGRDPT